MRRRRCHRLVPGPIGRLEPRLLPAPGVPAAFGEPAPAPMPTAPAPVDPGTDPAPPDGDGTPPRDTPSNPGGPDEPAAIGGPPPGTSDDPSY